VSKIEVEDLTISDAPAPAKVATPGVTPSQLDTSAGTITGVDKLDGLDRSKLPVEAKLILLCQEVKAVTGRDPRGGGHAIVGRPRVVLQLLIDADARPLVGIIRLQRPMVIGTSKLKNGETVGDADIVGWWQDIPIAVRSTVMDDNIHAVPLERVPRSLGIDRKQAGRIRMAAHHGGVQAMDDLRDDPRAKLKKD